MYGSLTAAVRILFEALASGVVPLDSDPPDVLRLPHPDDSCAVTRCQRYVLFNVHRRSRELAHRCRSRLPRRVLLRNVPKSSSPTLVVGSGSVLRTYDGDRSTCNGSLMRDANSVAV